MSDAAAGPGMVHGSTVTLDWPGLPPLSHPCPVLDSRYGDRMLRLVVMRHARTVNNHPSMPVISSGMPGPDISAEGVPDAEEVAKEIRRRFDVSAIQTSPLRRAVQTAEIIGAPLGLTPVVESALIECNVGSLENKSEASDFDILNGQLAQWGQPGGRSVRLGGDGESGDDVRDRIMRYLWSLDWRIDTTIVAVSHALALRCLMTLCNIDLVGRTGLSERLPENCGWALITSCGDKLRVADTHLWEW